MKQILIVDDAATVRMFHRNILAQAGYGVDEAVNGLEAVEKALNKTFDLYIVDVNMPKLDGYGFLKEIRSQPIPQVPAIVVSTEADEKDRELAYICGANDYLIKPTQPDTLLLHIKLLIGSA